MVHSDLHAVSINQYWCFVSGKVFRQEMTEYGSLTIFVILICAMAFGPWWIQLDIIWRHLICSLFLPVTGTKYHVPKLVLDSWILKLSSYTKHATARDGRVSACKAVDSRCSDNVQLTVYMEELKCIIWNWIKFQYSLISILIPQFLFIEIKPLTSVDMARWVTTGTCM